MLENFRAYRENSSASWDIPWCTTPKVLTIGSSKECAYWKGKFIKDCVLVQNTYIWIYSGVINVILAMGNLLALITKTLYSMGNI